MASITGAVVFFGLSTVLGIGVFIWRSLVVLTQSVVSYLRFANNYKYELGVTVLIFVVGIPFKVFQPDTMVLTDVVYECGEFRAAQIIDSAFIAVKTAYLFMTTRYNDVIIYFRNCISELQDDIRMIADIASIEGVSEAILAVWNLIIHLLRFGLDIPSLQIPVFTPALDQIFTAWICFYNVWIRDVFIALLRFTIFSEDCDLCEFTDEIGTTCSFTEFASPSVTPDCNTCHNFLSDSCECIIGAVDFVTDNCCDSDVRSLCDNTVCFIDQAWKRPFFILVGLIDGAIPNGHDCVQPGDVGDLVLAWIETWAGCLEDLFQDLFGISLADIIEMIFSFFVTFVGDVISAFNDMVACFESEDLRLCDLAFANSITNLGSVGETGACHYEGISAFPDGGIHICNNILVDCLDDISLFDGIFNSSPDVGEAFSFLLRFGFDTIMCQISIIATCDNDITCSSPTSGEDVGECCDSFRDGMSCMAGSGGLLRIFFLVIGEFASGGCLLIRTIASVVDDLFDIGLDVIRDIIGVVKCMTGECTHEGLNDPLGDNCGISDLANCIVECFDDHCACENRNDPGGTCNIAKSEPDWRSRSPEWKSPFVAKPRFGDAFADMQGLSSIEEARAIWKSHLEEVRGFANATEVYNDTFCIDLLLYNMPGEAEFTNKSISSKDYSNCLHWFAVGQVVSNYLDGSIPQLGFLDGVVFPSTMHDTIMSLLTKNFASGSSTGGRAKSAPVDPSSVTDMDRALALRDTLKERPTAFLWKRPFPRDDPRWEPPKEVEAVPQLTQGIKDVVTGSFYWQSAAEFVDRLYSIDNMTRSAAIGDGRQSAALARYKARYSPARTMAQMEYLQFVNRFTGRLDSHLAYARYKVLAKRASGDAGWERRPGNAGLSRYDPDSLGWQPRQLTLETMSKKEQEMRKWIEEERQFLASGDVQKSWKLFDDIYGVLNRRYKMDYWVSIQNVGGWFHAMSSGNLDELPAWFKGKRGYIPSKGFIPKDEYDAMMDEADTSFEGPIADLLSGFVDPKSTVIVRDMDYKFGPFLIFVNFDNVLPPIPDLGLFMARRNNGTSGHKLAQAAASSSSDSPFLPSAVTQDASAQTDFNDVFFDFVDFILGLFIDIGKGFRNGFHDLEDAVTSIDFQTFLLDPLVAYLITLITCDWPENIDGTKVYNPFCFPLIPEGLFNWLSPPPAGILAPQINWPHELVKDPPCISQYTGRVDPFFSFAFSDNCGDAYSTAGLRPFCPNCDYCERDYNECRVIGFRDFLDSTLFVLGATPAMVMGFLTYQFPIVKLYDLGLGLATIFLFGTTGPLGFFVFVPLVLGVSLLTWSISIVISGIPVAFIILVFTILIAYETPALQSNVFRATFGVISVMEFVWFITLFTGPPPIESSFSVNQIILDVLIFFDDNAFFNLFIPDLGFLRTRVSRFIYPGGVVPFLDYFCFAWTYSNFGLAVGAVFVLSFFATVGFQLLWQAVLFLWSTLLGVWVMLRTIALSVLQRNQEAIKLNQMHIERTVSRLRKSVEELRNFHVSLASTGALQAAAMSSSGGQLVPRLYERGLQAAHDTFIDIPAFDEGKRKEE